MSNRVDIEVEGFKELKQKIKQLDGSVKSREVEKIMRRVARPSLLAARREAPQGATGQLSKSISITRIRYRDLDRAGVKVSPSRRKAFYAHFVEYGHNIYKKGFRRKHRGGDINKAAAKKVTRANPFMERARQQTLGRADRDAQQRLARYVQKAISRLSNG